MNTQEMKPTLVDTANPGHLEDKEVTQTRPAAVRASSSTAPMNSNNAAVSDERWHSIQSGFVDDPEQSVTHAHSLVSDMLQQLIQKYTDERDRLEQRWSSKNELSTEDLRQCLQSYRALFSDLNTRHQA